MAVSFRPSQDMRRLQNDKLYLSDSDIGSGTFAKSFIAPKEVCGFLSGKAILFEDVIKNADRGCNSIQIGPGLYVDPLFPLRYVNHSCDPNVGLTDDLVLIAIRPIAENEEIRLDYSTTMYERYFTMRCNCNAPTCRGEIRDFDLLPMHLRAKYLRLNVVQSFIRNRMQNNGSALIISQHDLLRAIQSECSHAIGHDRVKTRTFTPIRIAHKD